MKIETKFNVDEYVFVGVVTPNNYLELAGPFKITRVNIAAREEYQGAQLTEAINVQYQVDYRGEWYTEDKLFLNGLEAIKSLLKRVQ